MFHNSNQHGNNRQTTVLVGGSNGTAALVSILGDRSDPPNAGHTVRVVSRNPSRFADGSTGRPIRWRCDEQKPFSDVAPSDWLPTTWTTHVGEADSVFGYDDVDEVTVPGLGGGEGGDDEGRRMYSGLERAISGLGAHDDGGPADVLLLSCPVSAHLPILRRIARALYRLEADGALSLPRVGGRGGRGGGGGDDGTGGRQLRRQRAARRPPLLIGTLYAAGGFDWMCRIAFASEKPATFRGTWSRDLALFGLKSFPYLCKSTEPGVVTMYGRYPVLTCAICPSTPRMRARAKEVLERALQSDATGKYLHFLGLSGPERYGGDGSAEYFGTDDAAAAAMAMAAAVVTEAGVAKGGGGGNKHDKARRAAVYKLPLLASATSASATTSASTTSKSTTMTSSTSSTNAIGPNAGGTYSVSMPMADHADPHSSLGFMSCTMNATNQVLHPCICAALFHDPANPAVSDRDGTIPWDASKEKTPLPRFYADGAAKKEAGRLLVTVAAAELYPLIDCLDRSLAPAGMAPVSRMHGGEPVGHFFMQELGNGPAALGRRSGLTDMAMKKLIFEEDSEDVDADLDDVGAGVSAGDAGSGSPIEPVGATRTKDGLINYKRFFEWSMSYMLSHNTRLGSVLSPCVVLPNDDPNDTVTRRIKPNVATRFFTDDVPHGLCIALGVAELFGFDLERDMAETLGLVRRLQRWMGKEYVVPAEPSESGDADGGSGVSGEDGGGRVRHRQKRLSRGGENIRIVADARDLGETSAPQAFGVRTVRDLRNFLAMSPFAEDARGRMEDRVGASSLVSRL